jgi:hypothetical protein
MHEHTTAYIIPCPILPQHDYPCRLFIHNGVRFEFFLHWYPAKFITEGNYNLLSCTVLLLNFLSPSAPLKFTAKPGSQELILTHLSQFVHSQLPKSIKNNKNT